MICYDRQNNFCSTCNYKIPQTSMLSNFFFRHIFVRGKGLGRLALFILFTAVTSVLEFKHERVRRQCSCVFIDCIWEFGKQ